MIQSSKFKYIDFFMKPALSEPLVYYMTEHQEEDGRKLYLIYSDFRKFLLTSFKINDIEGILFNLDSHQFVHLDGITGDFQTISIYEEAFNANFQTLVGLNEKKPPIDPYVSSKNKLIDSLKKWEDKNVFGNPYSRTRRL